MLIVDNMQLGQLIFSINRYFIKMHNNNLKKYNLSLQQSLIIIYLYKNPDCNTTQKILEEKLNVSNPTMTNIIKIMVSNNLVYKIQDKKDGRKYYLYATPKALELAPKCIEEINTMDKRLWGNISDDEQKTLINILKKVNID